MFAQTSPRRSPLMRPQPAPGSPQPRNVSPGRGMSPQRGRGEWKRLSTGTYGTDQAGVGIFFQQMGGERGVVYVAKIVPGGSADRSGDVIRIDDVLIKVEQQDVTGMPLSELRNLILGPQGSFVTLFFKRMPHTHGAAPYYFDVELMRGSPEYFETRKATMLSQEVTQLKGQLRAASTEIDRLRQGGARGGSSDTRTVQLESELRTRTDEVARLQEALRAEQNKARDAERHHREEMAPLHIEIQRLASREREAGAAFDEMKRRYEEEVIPLETVIMRQETEVQAARARADTLESRVQQLQNANTLLRSEMVDVEERTQALRRGVRAEMIRMEDAARVFEQQNRIIDDCVRPLDDAHHTFFASAFSRPEPQFEEPHSQEAHAPMSHISSLYPQSAIQPPPMSSHANPAPAAPTSSRHVEMPMVTPYGGPVAPSALVPSTRSTPSHHQPLGASLLPPPPGGRSSWFDNVTAGMDLAGQQHRSPSQSNRQRARQGLSESLSSLPPPMGNNTSHGRDRVGDPLDAGSHNELIRQLMPPANTSPSSRSARLSSPYHNSNNAPRSPSAVVSSVPQQSNMDSISATSFGPNTADGQSDSRRRSPTSTSQSPHQRSPVLSSLAPPPLAASAGSGASHPAGIAQENSALFLA